MIRSFGNTRLMTQTGSSIALAGPPVVGLRGIAPGRECCGWKTRRRAVGALMHPFADERACCSPFRRSEEHTSELQSLMRNSYAVFCLKKKKITDFKDTLDPRYNTIT